MVLIKQKLPYKEQDLPVELSVHLYFILLK